MKQKHIFITFIILSLIAFGPVTTSHAAVKPQHSIEYLSDGSYYETTITYNTSTPFLMRAASSTQSGRKTTTYTSSSGTKLWSVTVTGNFSYVKGKSAKCTSSSVSAASYSASWKISNKTSSKSGNTATATAIGSKYSGSTFIASYTRKVSLTCDVNGHLS